MAQLSTATANDHEGDDGVVENDGGDNDNLENGDFLEQDIIWLVFGQPELNFPERITFFTLFSYFFIFTLAID